MRKMLNGSYTVEASIVMIIVIWAVLSLFYWAFYVHDMVLMESVLKEAAEKARFSGEEAATYLLEEDAVKSAVPRLCAGHLQIHVTREQEEIEAQAEGIFCIPPWILAGLKQGTWERKEWQNAMRPQDYIRKNRGQERWNPDIKGN